MTTPPPSEYPNYPGGGGYQPPSEDPLVSTSIDGWLRRVVATFKRSFAALAMIQLVQAAVVAVSSVWFNDLMESLLTSGRLPDPERDPNGFSQALLPALAEHWPLLGFLALATVLATALVQGAGIYVAIRDAAGQPTRAGEGLRFAVTRLGPLFGWSLLCWALVMFGLTLFIVPGIYFAVVLLPTVAAVVVVEQGHIGRCFALVNPRFPGVFGRLLLVFGASVVYSVLLQAILTPLSSVGTVPLAVLAAVLQIPVGVAFTSAYVVTYAELRAHERGSISTPWLAAQLTGHTW